MGNIFGRVYFFHDYFFKLVKIKIIIVIINTFGFSFNKKSNEVTSTGEGLSGGSPSTLSFAAPDNFDGTNVLETGGFMSSVYDFGGSFLNENSLIHQYRSMSLYPEVDMAIEDIVTESIVFDSDGVAVKLNLGNGD